MSVIPRTLGDFELEYELGRGGMGVVYLARQRPLGRRVALKVLPHEFTEDPVRLSRFRREAEAISRLDHPNIVPIIAVGCDAGHHYIAMKYVPGVTVDGLVRARLRGSTAAEGEIASVDRTLVICRTHATDDSKRRIHARLEGESESPKTTEIQTTPKPAVSDADWSSRSVRIVEHVARALAHAHEHGIIHRDVKPGNILVDRDGHAWLLDFGLVRDVHQKTLTGQDGLVGTAQYMAPEQVRGKHDVDGRSDVYSLGMTLYEMVTLTRPFNYRETATILHAVINEEPPPPRRVNARVSDDLQTVIQKAIAKDPTARYQTATEFAEDLRRIRSFEPVRAQKPSLHRRADRFLRERPMLAGALVSAVFFLSAFAQYLVYRSAVDARRLTEALAEAETAFAENRFEAAADAYGFYLRLGGATSVGSARLADCRRRIDRLTLGLAESPR